MPKSLPKLIAIVGPTGSGKSELGVKLAKKFNGEIVSADSRQIYKGLIIGSNLVKGEFIEINGKKYFIYKGIIHHLVQEIEPNEDFTVASFKKLAIEKINEIIEKKKTPFLIGGTGLYIKAVIYNLKIPEIGANKVLRARLEKKSTEELFEDLKRIDPQTAEVIDRFNKVRLIRALEVSILSGKPFSQMKGVGEQLFDNLQIGIFIEKEILKKKLEKRSEQMLKNGLTNEVKNLLARFNKNLNCFSAIPYRLTIDYLEGKIGLEDLPKKIAKEDFAYAKRQMTWFKKDKNIKWVKDYEEAEKLVEEFLG